MRLDIYQKETEQITRKQVSILNAACEKMKKGEKLNPKYQIIVDFLLEPLEYNEYTPFNNLFEVRNVSVCPQNTFGYHLQTL